MLKEKEKELEEQYKLKISEIRTDVEINIVNLKTATSKISSSYAQVLSARESLRLAMMRLKAGITTQREVVNNQRDLTEAEGNYIKAITDYNINLVELSRNTGIENYKPCSNNSETKNKANQDTNHPIESNLFLSQCPKLL